MGRHPRLLYLDSARGLAALSVMTWHFLVMFISRDNVNLLKSPLHVFYYGEVDIIFFFIHSGFILSYSYSDRLSLLHTRSYLQFIVERIFRIFPLFLFLLLLSFLIQRLFYNRFDADLTEHAKSLWKHSLSISDLFKQSLLVILPESQNDKRLLPQDWTLSIELIVGALLPFLITSIKKSTLFFTTLFLILWQTCNTYVFEFGIGVLLYHFRDQIIHQWKTFNVISKTLSVVMAVLFYSCFFKFGSLFSPENIIFSYSIDRFIVNIGCALFFMIIISSKHLQKLLSYNWLVKIGKICYSLYLWHMLLLIVVVPKFYVFAISILRQPLLSIIIVFILFLILTIFLSALSFKYIEVPFNKLGKMISYSIGDFRQSAARK